MTFLSVCLYTDRSSAELERALALAADHFDEVCLVDLSAQGEALPAAEAAGAMACRYRWSDHATEALNVGLQLASGDWTLLATPEELIDGLAEAGRSAAQADSSAVALGATRQVGPLLLPIQRGIPSGHEFKGREEARLEPAVEATTELPGYQDPGQPNLPFEGAEDPRPTEQGASATEAGDPCEGAYERGLELYGQGEYEQALGVLSEAVELLSIEAPFSAHLLETVSYCLRAVGRGEEGLDLLLQVAGHFPDRVDTQFLLALLSLEAGQFEHAEIGFQRCLQLANVVPTGGPSEAARGTYVALHNLGALRETLEMEEEAMEYYRRALAKNPFYGPSRDALERLEQALAEPASEDTAALS